MARAIATSTRSRLVYGGMRGMIALICETSEVDKDKGIAFRGKTIPEIREKLTRAEGGCEPLPEALLWLLMTGDFPTKEQTRGVSKDLAKRICIPPHVEKTIKGLPPQVHPMDQFCIGVNAMSSESIFTKQLSSGKLKKTQYWELVYEDSMNLIANLTLIAALVYHKISKEKRCMQQADPNKDWSYNFTRMMGFDSHEFDECMRLYLTLHSDHEGGNVSAHTAHLVASALSNPYMSFAAAMNGLAGPLHGLANQEVLIFIMKMREKLGDSPSDDQAKTFIEDTLKSGQVIPGFGHAVLRKTDPRYTAFVEFAETHIKDDPLVKMVSQLLKVVPPILQATGKVQNPWPNIDASTGALLQYYCMPEMNFYTVLFGVARSLGVLSSMVWSRAMGLPIERPKSMPTDRLIKMAGGGGADCSKDKKKK